ncbi:MAG: hypothetical protein ACRD30_07420 [Bryobacteraceae bacterium]
MFSLASMARATPNFSGEWKMNIALSEFGPVPAPEMLTRSIKHEDPSLQISTYQKGAQGESRTELKYTTDGAPSVNKLPGGDATGTAKWDGYRLIIDSTREFAGKKITYREVWALSGGGKVLTISSHVNIPGQGEFDLKYVFDKQ